MQQIKYEIIKHINKFTVGFIAVMFILNLAVVFFQYINYLDPQTNAIKQAKSELFEDYANNREKFDEDYADFQSRLNEYNAFIRQAAFSDEPFNLKFINKKIDLEYYGDIALYGEVFEIINRAENYNNDINKVIHESYSKIKATGIQKNQYVYEYQVALITHYSKLADLEIKPENQYGWSEFFTLKTPVIFLVITFLGVFANVFIIEKRTKIVNILNICKNGGYKLITAKLITVIAFSVTLTLLFSLSPLIILNFTTGLSNPFQYIQAVNIFGFCPYILTIFQYLIIFISVKIFIFTTFALFTAILGQLLYSEVFVFSISFVFLILNYLLSLVNVNSPFFFLKKFNFFDLAFVNVLFDKYRALNIFNFHVGFLIFVIVLIFIIFAAIIIISFILKVKNKSDHALLSFLNKVINKFKTNKKANFRKNIGTSTLKFEFDKYLFNKARVLILIAVILIKILMANIYFTPLITNEEKIYKNYIDDLSGGLNAEKTKYIANEREYINTSIAEYELAKIDLRDGKIDLNKFQQYSQKYNYAKSVENAFIKVEKRYNYLTELSNNPENYNNIEFIYEYGAVKYLFSFFDIILVVFALVMFSVVFSNEYQSGFNMIMSISKNGGKKTFNSKYIFGFFSITIIYLIFSAVDLFFLCKNFDMNYLNAGVMSIPDLAELEINMSILKYFIIFKAISYVCFVILALIILSLSNITKNVLKSVLAAVFIIFVPSFLGYFGVNVLSFINIASILNPTFITKYIPQYIFYLIFTTVLYFKSRFYWVKK